MDIYQLTVYALIAGFVLVFWRAAQWATVSARTARDSEALTPADLMALQEACEGLISDLRAAADDATARVNLAVAKAEIVLDKLSRTVPVDAVLARAEVETPAADSSVEAGTALPPSAIEDQAGLEDPVERVWLLADRGHSCEEIARMEQRSPGEVRLILDLRQFQVEHQAA